MRFLRTWCAVAIVTGGADTTTCEHSIGIVKTLQKPSMMVVKYSIVVKLQHGPVHHWITCRGVQLDHGKDFCSESCEREQGF